MWWPAQPQQVQANPISVALTVDGLAAAAAAAKAAGVAGAPNITFLGAMLWSRWGPPWLGWVLLCVGAGHAARWCCGQGGADLKKGLLGGGRGMPYVAGGRPGPPTR